MEVKKEPTGQFRIYVLSKTFEAMEQYERKHLKNCSKEVIKKYFKDIIKNFNDTLKPDENERKLLKVKQEFVYRYKTKNVKKFINVR